MSQEKEKRKSRQKRKRSSLEKALGTIALCLLLTVACYLVYSMSLTSGVPDSGVGIISTDLYTTEGTLPPTTAEPTTQAPTETEEPTTEEPTTEAPTEPPLEPHVALAMATLKELSLEEKIWQMIFLTPDELTDTTGPTLAGAGTQEALGQYPVGGLVYFGEHIIGQDQIRTMISNTQSYSKIPLFIAVDEEGGLVSRLSKIGVTDWNAPMAEYGAAGDSDAVYELGQEFSQQLASVGFNLDFAPVADIVTNPYNTEIGSRSFSEDPAVAAQMVAQMVKGLQEGNMISCLKHFPGHGSTSADSHYGQSVSQRTLEELRAEEFLPFRAGIDAGAELVMISHMSAPNVTGDNEPCDFSYQVVTGLLRQELGFQGVIITDSHEMGAISYYYDCGEAAVRAIQAGCDVVLMPMDKLEAFQAILAAVEEGTITEERINESVLRILSLKCEYGIIAEEAP